MVEVMREINLSVLGLCETRIKGNGETELHGDYKLIFSGRDDGRHGVGVVVTAAKPLRSWFLLFVAFVFGTMLFIVQLEIGKPSALHAFKVAS